MYDTHDTRAQRTTHSVPQSSAVSESYVCCAVLIPALVPLSACAWIVACCLRGGFRSLAQCVYSNYVPDQIDGVSLAIDRSGRRMLYSLSPGADELGMAARIVNETNMYDSSHTARNRTQHTQKRRVLTSLPSLHPALCLMPRCRYRVTGDTWDRWESSIYSHFQSAQRMQPYIAYPNGRSDEQTAGTHRQQRMRGCRSEWNRLGRCVTSCSMCAHQTLCVCWSDCDALCCVPCCWLLSYGLPSWPDLDMLPLGYIGREGANEPPSRLSNLTVDEQQSLMSLWIIFRSPLMYGGDLQHPDNASLALLTNVEALAISDNSTNTDYVLSGPTLAVWRSDDADWQRSGVSYFSLHNIGNEQQQAITLSTRQLRGKQAGGQCTLRDIWARKDVQHAADLTFTLRPHQSGLYSLHSCTGAVTGTKQHRHQQRATE